MGQTNKHPFSGLRIARYECILQCQTDVILGDFPGDVLRSSLGHVLRQMNCLENKQCSDICNHPQQCTFGEIFQSRIGGASLPQPYVLEINWKKSRYTAGENIYLRINTIGEDCIAPFVSALLRIEHTGLWTRHGNHGKVHLVAVNNLSPESPITIYCAKKSPKSSVTEPIKWELPSQFPQRIKLEFISPLRIERKHRPLRKITLSDIVASLYNRVKTLMSFRTDMAFPYKRQELFAAAKIETVSSHMKCGARAWRWVVC